MPHSPPPAAAAEADPQEAEPCSIDSLPDSLLGHIMALTGSKEGRGLMLVSRRWHRVVFSEPSLWRSLAKSGFDVPYPHDTSLLKQHAALWQRVAPHVVHFAWERDYGGYVVTAEESIVPYLSDLYPSRLADLELWHAEPALLVAAGPALQRLTSVTSLVLSFGIPSDTARESSSAVVPALAAVNRGLRSLQLVDVWEELNPAALGSIVQLAQLTFLSMCAYAWPPLASLTRLSQLKQLFLNHQGESVLPIPEPASFPAGLERFILTSLPHQAGLLVCGCELERCQLWQGSVSSFAADWLLQSPPRYKPLLTLTLDLVGPMPSLARLLSALQPAGMQAPAFQRLELEGVLPEPAAMAGCTQLQQLQQLSMCVGEYETDPDGLRLALPVLLKQASRLASLSTDGYKLGSPLPGCLRSYCGLTRLALLYHSLTDLPAGEYLQDLHFLDLRCNHFTQLPAALSAATGLTHLDLSVNSRLVLSDADLQTLLALTRLQVLELYDVKHADPALLRELQRHMPSLTIEPEPVT